jgi:mycothione reductase
MKKYDLIVVGSGAGMNVAWRAINQDMQVALVENGPMGGTCLNVGCVPSKILIYPADVIRMLGAASAIGIDGHIDKIDFALIMKRMHAIVDDGRSHMERGAKNTENLDWYQVRGEFVDDYQLKVGEESITAPKIVIASGSRAFVPPIPGLDETGFLDNTTVLSLEKPPDSLIVIGGGYIACEYGHFFSAMGTDVTILGRSPRLLPNEDREVSEIVKRGLSKYIDVRTNHEVIRVKEAKGKKVVTAFNRSIEDMEKFYADEVMLAAGRRSNADLLKPEKSGVETDKMGWIKVNEFLETTKPGIWALGDAIGKHMFRHTANYESKVVWSNAFTDDTEIVDYHAVPHAVFTYPQVGSVGMTEEEAQQAGYEILVGRAMYGDVAKGYAMGEEDGFVKVIVNRSSRQILGCQIVGPEASDLVQQVVYLMNTESQDYAPLARAQVIHPALSEVVARAFANMLPVRTE